MIFRRSMVIAAALLAASSAVAADYFEVKVHRVAQDLYEVEGEGIYIKTRFCFAFSFGEEAVVRIDGFNGFVIGKIVFKESGDECDIAKLQRP